MKNKEKPHWIVWVQTIGVIIGLVSLGLNASQYSEKKAKEKAWDVIEGRLIERVREGTARWLGAERRVAEHEKRIVDLNELFSVTLKAMQFHRDNSERHKEQADKYKTMAEYYEGKYNDYSPILNLNDSEHFEFFLEWTTPGL